MPELYQSLMDAVESAALSMGVWYITLQPEGFLKQRNYPTGRKNYVRVVAGKAWLEGVNGQQVSHHLIWERKG